MQATFSITNAKPVAMSKGAQSVAQRNQGSMNTYSMVPSQSQYSRMSGINAGKMFAPSNMSAKNLSMGMQAPKSFFGQAPNVMRSMQGKSTAT